MAASGGRVHVVDPQATGEGGGRPPVEVVTFDAEQPPKQGEETRTHELRAAPDSSV